MTSIVSPWLLYAIYICNTLNFVVGMCFGINCIATSFFLWHCAYWDEDTSPTEHKKYVHLFKISLIPLVILGFVELIIPSKEVLYQMLATYYVTPDNITAVQGNIVDFVSQLKKVLK